MADNVDQPLPVAGPSLDDEGFGLMFEEIYKGFNGSATTGLAKGDIQLSAATKFLKIDPNYIPKAGDFFMKLEEWNTKDHGMYALGLVGSVKRFMKDTLEPSEFAAMTEGRGSQHTKTFHLMCGAAQALSVSNMIGLNMKETLLMDSMKKLYEAPAADQPNAAYVAAHAEWVITRTEAQTRARQEYELAVQDRDRNRRILEEEAESRLGSAHALRETLVSGFANLGKKYKTKVEVMKAVSEYVSEYGKETFKCVTDVDKKGLAINPSGKRAAGSSTDVEEEPTEESRTLNARLTWAKTWFDRVVIERDVGELVDLFSGDPELLNNLNAVQDYEVIDTLDDRMEAVNLQHRSTEPMEDEYGRPDSDAVTANLKAEYVCVRKDKLEIKYDGSVLSEALPNGLLPTTEQFRAVTPFLYCDNLLSIVRYMVVLAKLNWFRTNHHTGTEVKELAPNLRDALTRALGTMPVELPEISVEDVRDFITKHLHTISHWASTHLVFCGLYMPSERAVAGEFYWSRHPSRSCLIRPDDDIRRGLLAAPANVSKYYLSHAGVLQFANSPAWALLSKAQLITVSQTVDYARRIQLAARGTFSKNERKIRAASPETFYATLPSCRRDGRFNYHPAHHFMNSVQQMTVPDCQAIGIIGMIVMALHPTSTLAKAPCFGKGPSDRSSELAVYRSSAGQEMEMNSALPGYEEETFSRLKALARALRKGSDVSVKALATTSDFNSESVELLGMIGRRAGIHSTTLTEIKANLSRTISLNKPATAAAVEEDDID